MDVQEIAQRWTIADLERLPEQFRYEIVDGHLLVTPPPTFGHETTISVLMTQLVRLAEPPWRVYPPGYINFEGDARIPDLLVLDGRRLPERRSLGAPPDCVGLAVEVVSPSSRRTDRILKPAEYAAAGIPLYWRVEQEPDVEVHAYRLQDGVYAPVSLADGRCPVPWGEIALDLSELR